MMGIIQAAALLAALNFMSALFSDYSRLNAAQPTGRLIGVVVDIEGARVAHAAVTIEGDETAHKVTTGEDGTYQINLPVGTYRMRVESEGFCPVRRGAFQLKASFTIAFDFALLPCSIVNRLTKVEGNYKGEVDSYEDPFKEEVLSPSYSMHEPFELLVRYGKRQAHRNNIEYRGAVIDYDVYAPSPTGATRRSRYLRAMMTYNLLTIRANKLRLHPRAFRLEAEGDVTIDDGKRRLQAKRAVVELRKGEPSLRIKR